jgi:nucleoside-diphosphate-sugar epimerase
VAATPPYTDFNHEKHPSSVAGTAEGGIGPSPRLNPENRRNLCWATRARIAIQKLFRPVEPHHLVSNAAKARRRLNWQPEITFEQIITPMKEAEWAALRATG